MATEEDLKKAEEETADEAEETEAEAAPKKEEARALARAGDEEGAAHADAEGEAKTEGEGDPNDTPLQLGYLRYVYAAYMAGALGIAFLVAKIGHATWQLIGKWKPDLGAWGEPKDEYVYPVAAAVGIGVAIYYWRKATARQYANEVAEELSKVTWPTRKEVMNSTTVVILTTVFATVFFALMDQFWKYVTDKIYTF